MSITKKELAHLAYLARLQVSDDLLSETTRQINDILGFIGQLNTVDTKSIVPMSHPLDMAQRLRVDKASAVSESQCAAFSAIAPEQAQKLYLVPSVME